MTERRDGGRLIPSEPYSRERGDDGTTSPTTMKQKKDENGNELIDFKLTIYIPEDTTSETGVDDSPTEEEKKAADSVPIFYTIAQTAAIERTARAAHADELADAMEQTARDIASRLAELSVEPAEENKQRFTTALAMALHLASTAAASGITIPTVKRYPVDINTKHFTALFAAAAREILTAHGDGRREDETHLSELYDDATGIIRKAAAHTPIRHAEAAAIIGAIEELNIAVANG